MLNKSSCFFPFFHQARDFDDDLFESGRVSGYGSVHGYKLMNDDGYRHQLLQLKLDHRDLDDAIAALREVGPVDQLQIARLKKRKLALKDRIIQLEDQLIPDIIA
jgi:hypothetical protein